MGNTLKPDWDPKSEEVLNDQLAAYDAMRERCPVAYSDFMQWSLFRHDDVMQVLHDHRTFSNAVSQHVSVPNGMDPPEHTHFRRIIEPYFTPERMSAFEPDCRKIATDLIQGALASSEIELMADVALPFAARVQCASLGWPESVHELLVNWINKNQEATLAQDKQVLSKLAVEFDSIINQQLNRRTKDSAKPQDDITTALMNEQVQGRPLNNTEIVSILRNWTAGEVGTISAAVGILVHYLARHVELQAQLREQPSLLLAAIDEILRIHGPLVANRRVTTQPVEIGGHKIEAGERISLIWLSANRDSDVFDEPDTFRLDRGPDKNLLYGAGIHVCPGAPLARMELRVVVEELLKHSSEMKLIADKLPTNAQYPASGFATLPVRIR